MIKFANQCIDISFLNRHITIKHNQHLNLTVSPNVSYHNLFLDHQRVQDDFRYVLTYTNNQWVLSPYNNTVKSNRKYVLLLLESPHTDEYNTRNFPNTMVPIRPANGKTGRKLDLHLMDVLTNPIQPINSYKHNNYPNYNQFVNRSFLSQLNLTYDYVIILSNPVQFQASLGSFYHGRLNKVIRDRVWIELYKTMEEQSFIHRIANYPSVDYILNCCTGSKFQVLNTSHRTTTNLKRIVHLTLSNNFSRNRITVFNAAHPLKWGKNTAMSF